MRVGDDIVGSVLEGRYRVIRLLGEGGMGAVYAGEHLKLGRPVAIKVLHPQFAKNPQVVARFHQEAQAASSIGHPNIIEVVDLGERDDGSTFMVLEFLEGQDWSEELEARGPAPLSRVASILMQTCDALEAAHAQGIVHRDLKPENLFLIERHGRDDFVKVLDFGISKVLPTGEEHRALTQTNMMLGTAYYMSPEQTKAAKHVDHRSDIWTLGVIFFRALTGQYPFDDEALPMLFVKICADPAPKLLDYRKDLPPAAESVFQRLVQKDPKKRYQSVAQLRSALAEFVDHDAAPELDAEVESTKDRGTSLDAVDTEPVASAGTVAAPRSPALPIALTLLVLLGLGGAAYAITQPEEPPPPVATEAAPEEGHVRITVFTDPPEATIYLDGEAQRDNPLQLEVPETGDVHTFEARAEGYESRTQRIAYVESRSVELRLQREAAEPPPETEPATMRATSGPRTTMARDETPMREPETTMAEPEVTPPPEMAPAMMEETVPPTPMMTTEMVADDWGDL